MLVEQKQQSILISGESGAGKTEAVKACLRFIVSRSNEAARGHPEANGPAARAAYIEECIMQANPLLEALGNAKTLRNGNSSRFGKWVEVQFDASGFITASRITSYLLEKSRVVEHGDVSDAWSFAGPIAHAVMLKPLSDALMRASCAWMQMQGERTYHVMYQLCRGCTTEQGQELELMSPTDFRYISASASIAVPGVDDKLWWAATCKAMNVFAFSLDDQKGLRNILAAILHVGNLEFEAVKLEQQDDGSAVSDSSKPHLVAAAKLLALAPESFEQALTVKSVGKFPVVQVPQSPGKATATRDALARALYGHFFTWTIGRINTTMGKDQGAVDAKRTIGMLDIFGFESFQTNSLEQLLINFANEKLQAHFNEYIFRLEEAECQAEGVACPKLTFADNSLVMSLMTTKPTGVLSLLNEEVLVPNASDVNLLQKLLQNHQGHSEFKALPRAHGEGFIIQHYAGPVGYLIDGFVEKNRDQLPGELVQLVGTSKLPLLEALFKQGIGSDKEGGQKTARAGGARGRTGGASGRRTSALAAQFADSLDALISMLQTTTPHFVRCVKPNAELVSDKFDGGYVMRQLREMGMVHVVRARKQGYAHRYPFDRFASRYGYLTKGEGPDEGFCKAAYIQHLGTSDPPCGERRECVTMMCTMAADGILSSDGWAVGTSKVFLKEAQQHQLEVAREAYLLRVVTEQLEQAISQRDISALEAAVAGALEVQLQSPLIATAQQLLTLLQAQAHAASALEEALGSRDLPMLDAALATAAKAGLAGELVQQAQQLRSQLMEQHRASTMLGEALRRNDIQALSVALADATRVGLNTGLVKEAQRRLDGLQRATEIDHDLQQASQATNLATLSQLLQRAEEIALDTPAVRAAQQRRGDLQEGMHLRDSLTQATAQSGSTATLHSLIAKARAHSVQTEELKTAADDAERFVAEREHAELATPAAGGSAAGTVAAAVALVDASASPAHAELVQTHADANAAVDGMQTISISGPPHTTMTSEQYTPPPAQSGGEAIVPSPEGERAIPCVHLTMRCKKLQQGTSLIKVAPAFDRWKERAMPRFFLDACRRMSSEWKRGLFTLKARPFLASGG